MKSSCPICQNSPLQIFIERQKVPVHQNFICKSKEEALAVNRGDLKLAFCKDCGFVFNAAFDPNLMQYGKYYDADQDYSPSFYAYMDRLIKYLEEKGEVKNKHIVEIGSGNGKFLQRLVLSAGGSGYGFDPSYKGKLSLLDGKVKFEKCFYDENCAKVPAEVVICRHVLAHLEDPVAMFQTVRKALRNSPKAVLFFETPDVRWVLEHGSINDFFYEYCSYFSRESLTAALQQAGFEVREIINEFGGQYLWCVATLASQNFLISEGSIINPETSGLSEAVGKYVQEENKIIAYWKNKIATLASSGKTAVWGAGAKGVTLVNLTDSPAEKIDCLIDINPQKQGGYVLGTGHRICSLSELKDRKINFVIVMNPNYLEEIRRMLEHENIVMELINYDSPE